MLVIGGVVMPEPRSLTVSKNKVWSSNAGRTASAMMVGDLVAIKYKLKIQWAALDSAEAALIDAQLSKAFFPVTFVDPASGGETTLTFYAGDPEYPVYSYVIRGITYYGVSVDLIQQ